MNLKPSYNSISFAAIGFLCTLIIISAFLQAKFNFTPGIYTHAERFVLFFALISFLFNTQYTHTKNSKKILGIISLSVCVCGMLITCRHIFLQKFGQNVSTINAVNDHGLIWTNNPLAVTFVNLWRGNSFDLHAVATIYGMNIATWTFFAFLILSGVCIFQMRYTSKE